MFRPPNRIATNLLTCLLLLVARAYGADQPNILFIFTDDHAPHAIGAYDGWLKGVNPTPNIDQLAREGMVFRNSFCTNSICGPSRAVILTGVHNHINGFMHNGNNFDGSQETFPKLLKKVGYETAILGKWHLKSDPQGFDYWRILPGQGDYYNPMLLSAEGKTQVRGYCTDIVTDLAIQWLNGREDPDKPFLLMCQHKAPHRCWMPPLRHINLYDDIQIPEPPHLFDEWQDNASPARFQEMEIDGHMNLVFDVFADPPEGFDPQAGLSVDRSGVANLKKMTPAQRKIWDAKYRYKNEQLRLANLKGQDLVRWKYQRYAKNYLRCVKGVDESVGQLLQYLKETGLEENTIVIYCSDQGFYIGDHGWYDKRWMYEESLKMPFIIKWPGVVEPGSTNEDMIQNLDYAPTFLQIAGAEPSDRMQGASLLPLLKGEQPDEWRDSIYYHYYEYPSVHMVPRHRGVRTERYKLIHFYQFDEWEFYDLREDPDELLNVYGEARYQETIKEMKQRLSDLADHYQDDSDISVKPQEWQEQMHREGSRVTRRKQPDKKQQQQSN